MISLHYSTFGTYIPQVKSGYFWFYVLHFLPLLVSMPSLIIMAILPDDSDNGKIHLGAAILGMGCLLLYALCNAVFQVVRMVKLVRNSSSCVFSISKAKSLPNVVFYFACSMAILFNLALVIAAVVGMIVWMNGNLLGEWVAVFTIVGTLLPLTLESISLSFLLEQTKSEATVVEEEENKTLIHE
ncbi:hypothetical protein C9374_001172 [Naegleria lovaniensis]|uniref:Uncharacterized protein n=1 Tax=Naegleria lovaniensis TaxID=51637 RepID=A0AA88KMH6_NAELO|nr:uncharacterized protein C9374_001172 [Naegleria lovaniensis]KAG2387578.1 hypothetical protein C9374_001172 [Naegleria lovaniensis]